MSVLRIDLYSDTQTRPTPAMRRAMADAEVGDDHHGADPTVNGLCAEVAEQLGQEAALFLPSGTMCNLVGVAAHTRPGDAIVLDHLAHIARSETGGAAAVNGVVTDLVVGERGQPGPEQIAEALTPGNIYQPHPRLVCLEQTHNFAGGAVWPLERYTAVIDVARARSVPVHVDGARLYNAVVASRVDAAAWGRPVDSIWIDFTKGLGAPIGAVLAGSAEFVEHARLFKHRFGGAMRQSGIAAAACVHALHHHVDRLADDHATAAFLAGELERMGLAVDGPVETNIVFFHPPAGTTAAEVVQRVRAGGVRLSRVGERLRAVTHLDVGQDDVAEAAKLIEAALDA